MKITMTQITDLNPYARNSRTHSKGQVEKLAVLIRQFGWTNPVIADQQGVVAGHGRLIAAKHIYAAGETIYLPSGEPLPHGAVPVIDCTGWSDAQRRAYVIADNRSAEDAGWDIDLLKIEMAALQVMDFDLQLTGFTVPQVDKIMALDDLGNIPEAGSGEECGQLIACPKCGYRHAKK